MPASAIRERDHQAPAGAGLLRAAMAVGETLVWRGELQRRAERALRDRPVALERQRQLAASGSRLGTTRLNRFAHAASSGPARSATRGSRTSTGAATATGA